MPLMCVYHVSVYATRIEAIRYAVPRPGGGLKALAREATNVARACPLCPDPEPR